MEGEHELFDWLAQEDIPPLAWQQAHLESAIVYQVENAVAKIVPHSQPNLASFEKALKWAYIYQGLLWRKRQKSPPKIRFELHALSKVLKQWHRNSPQERKKQVLQILLSPEAWNIEAASGDEDVRQGWFALQREIQQRGRTIRLTKLPWGLKPRGRMALVALVGVGVLLLLLLAGGLWMIRKGRRSAVGGVGTTPTAGPLSKPTKSMGAFPSPSPSPSPSPAVPTPTPTSQYQQVPLQWVMPPLPHAHREVLFLIDDEYARLSPVKGWQTAEGGIGHQHRYWDREAQKVPLAVRWTLDVPLPREGVYEVYVAYPGTYSAPVSLPYQVLVDGKKASPVVGSPTLQIEAAAESPTSFWHSLGVYALHRGASLAVHLDLPSSAQGLPSRVRVDAVAIAYVQSPEVQKCAPWPQIRKQAGYPIYWKEASQGKRDPQQPDLWQEIPSDSLAGCGPIWRSEHEQTQVTWTFPYVLPGEYRLCAWVPVPDDQAYTGVLSWRVTWETPNRVTWSWASDIPSPTFDHTVDLPVQAFNQLVCLGSLKVEQATWIRVQVQGKTPPLIANAVFLTSPLP